MRTIFTFFKHQQTEASIISLAFQVVRENADQVSSVNIILTSTLTLPFRKDKRRDKKKGLEIHITKDHQF